MKNKHEFTIKIDGEEWEKAQDVAFQKRNKNAKIAGFRPGKAPKDVFIKHYGKESLYFDAADSLLNVAYSKMLEKEKVVPVVEPKVDIKSIDETGIEYIFTVITKPEVKIKKYKKLGVKKEEVKVTKEEINHEIEHLLDRYTELVTKEKGKVEKGNIAVIDFEGFKDGKAFEGGKGENYSLEIGSNTFIPGFEDAVIGMKTGEEKDINVTFPEDYGEKSLAGAPVVFKVKVNEIKEKVTRELDKDFFEDLGMDGVDSKESLEKEIKETIKARKEADAENKYVDDLLAKIGENTEVDIPEEMIDEEIHRLIHRFEEQLRMQGVSLDLYYEFTKTTHEDLHKQMEGEAKKNVLYRLILEELVKLEKVEVTLEDGEAEADKLAAKYNMKKEDLLKEFGGLDMIMYDLEVRKVFDKLKEYNK
jgi:trigger factor